MENIQSAGLVVEREENLIADVLKFLVAHPSRREDR
jgi:hypothetical protein